MESQTALDITGAEVVELLVKKDGKVIWVNTEDGCVLRICRIKHLVVTDERENKETMEDVMKNDNKPRMFH